jgi:DNA mismatch endonuclease (patch repair protein)
LSKWKTVIFVHGCFWHGHDCCEGHVPKSNTSYWALKLKRNCHRDLVHAEALQMLGWHHIIIWECQTYSLRKIEDRLRCLLHEGSSGQAAGRGQAHGRLRRHPPREL